MGAGGAVAVAAGCEQKPEKLIPMLVPPTNFEYTPQTAYQYMTTCSECEAACGMMVTVRENRAQKAEGNPLHPLNQGTLCALGQASMQTLYNPHRLSHPQLDGKQVGWDGALESMSGKLKEASGSVVYLGRPSQGSEGGFIDEWLKAIGGGRRIGFNLLDSGSMREANRLCFGRADVPEHVFEDASIVFNFGADFLETWGNPVENARRFAETHAYRGDGKKIELIHFGPHISLSGAKADRWQIINPGTEGLAALALASVIRAEKGNFPFLEETLERYTPEKVADACGVSAEKLRSWAKRFIENSPSLAIGGGCISATTEQPATYAAVNILNAVAGNVGKTIRFFDHPLPEDISHRHISELINELNAGKVKVLVIDDINPLHVLPNSVGLAESMRNAFVISIASQKTETTHAANLVLPALTAYETWGDAAPRSGIHSIRQPVMAPVTQFDAKAREDILLQTAQIINPEAFSGIRDYQEYLRGQWQMLYGKTGGPGDFENFWINTLENGGVFSEPKIHPVNLRPEAVSVKLNVPAIDGKGMVLLPSPSLMHNDGRGARNPWLQEAPNPVSQIVWDSWIEINPETAKKMGIADRSVIEIKTNSGTIKGTALYHFGIHRDAIAIPIGQGHRHSGDVADGFGVNVMNILPEKYDGSGNLAFVSTRAQVTPLEEPSYMVNLDGNARQLGRNIAAAATVEELQNGEEHHPAHTRPVEEVEFYPPRSETAGYYKPYRWGMTIDLDRCNGCSACVVACYAENNLPVVGKMRTAIGREMSWIRMERYIEGYGDDFEIRFTPMLCQQCANAGCEPVCPVYATYHNPEGVNSMIYNRCVGTRYCSNNCAYKVRRFNWFDYEFPAPLNQQLNSSITTRSVGVMEKCNFCRHRLTAARHEANELGRDIQDGEVLTACQQTCPTRAITFGNLMDSESQVSKNAIREQKEKRDRQYEVLAELNYKPGVTYMKKVNTRVAGNGHEKGESSHA